MSEESTNEVVVELDTDIVATVFVDQEGKEFPINTPYYEREVMIPKKVRTPLYVNGVRLGDSALSEMGLSIKEITRAEQDQRICAALYAQDAEGDGALKLRVTQYKATLDALELPYTASQDEIMTAIQASNKTDAEKAELALTMKTIYDAITTNLEFYGSETPHKDTYLMISKLIKYLPQE